MESIRNYGMRGVTKKSTIAQANGTVKLSNGLIGPIVNASATVPTRAPREQRMRIEARLVDMIPVDKAIAYESSAPKKAKTNIIAEPSNDLSENG